MENQEAKNEALIGGSELNAGLALCSCGWRAKGKGRTLECSNPKCSRIVMMPSRIQAIDKWNVAVANAKVSGAGTASAGLTGYASGDEP